MNASDWKKNEAGCVFYQDPANEVHGVGHTSFTKSPEGGQDWIVYNGMKKYAIG
jgi:GH43 family beta-xylosidase